MAGATKQRRKRWPYVVVAIVLLASAGFGAYKLFFEQPSQLEIEAAMEAQDWSRAAFLLRRANLEDDDGRNHFHLGMAAMNLGDTEGAIEAFMGADDRGYRRSRARYYVASLYAKQGKEDLAIQWMGDAFDAGFMSQDQIARDPALQRLTRTVAWRERFGGDEPPSEPLRALDFLLGSWTVTPSDGFGGRNVTIAREMEGLVSETWPADGPGGASGVFRFDTETQRWHYSYVDGYGRVFEGEATIGKQVSITGTWRYADGTEFLRRIDIRASSGLIDYVTTQSSDGGKTWDEETRRRLSSISDQARSAF